jgi:hypothetical protein
MGLDGGQYDAALKRLKRKLPEFKEAWLAQKGMSEEDWRNLP